MGSTLLSLAKIWDAAPHNAFTDLVRFRSSWFLAFREGDSHMLCEGRIRVLRSADGAAWESAALIEEDGIDLRDPHFSVVADGELELVMGGTRVAEGKSVGRRPRIARSADGASWSPNEPIMAEGDWLWRVERRRGEAFGVSYRLPRKNFWTVHLCRSADGRQYRDVAKLGVRGKPNETTVRFLADGTMIALVRREAGNGKAWIGRSGPPYEKWNWKETGEYLGGPNFIVLPNGELLAAGRVAKRVEKGDEARRAGASKAKRALPATALLRMTDSGLVRDLELPSGGDCSYPGMVFRDGLLWLSYYSSHEGKSSIYLGKIDLGMDKRS